MREYIRTKKMLETPVVEGVCVACDVCKKTIFDSKKDKEGFQDWYTATMDTHYTPDGFHYISPTQKDYCSNECLSKAFLEYTHGCSMSRANRYEFHVDHITDSMLIHADSEMCNYSKKGITRG